MSEAYEYNSDIESILPKQVEPIPELDEYLDQWAQYQKAREEIRPAEDTLDALKEAVTQEVVNFGPVIYNGRKLAVSTSNRVHVADWLKDRAKTEGAILPPWVETSLSAPYFIAIPSGGWPKREKFIPRLDGTNDPASAYISAWIEVNQNEHVKNARDALDFLKPQVMKALGDIGSCIYKGMAFIIRQNFYVNPTAEAKEAMKTGNVNHPYPGLNLVASHTLRCSKAPK
jgi:hypothetical protein